MPKKLSSHVIIDDSEKEKISGKIWKVEME